MSYQSLCCDGCGGFAPIGIVCYEELAQANIVDGCDFIWGSLNKVNDVATLATPLGNITATISEFQGITIPVVDYANWACYPNGHPNPANEFDWNLWIFNDINPANLTIDFSQPVLNPVMALQSLGSNGVPVVYTFSVPYVVIFSDGVITAVDGTTTISAEEGEAIIYFPGVHSSIGVTANVQDNFSLMDIGLFNEFALEENPAAIFVDCDEVVTYRDLLTGAVLVDPDIVACTGESLAPTLSVVDVVMNNPDTLTLPVGDTVSYSITIETGTADINGATRPTSYSISRDYVYHEGKLITYPSITIDNLSVGAVVHVSYVTI